MRALYLLVGIAACKTTPAPIPVPEQAPLVHDPLSYAEPERVAVEHLSLDLTVDFTQHILHGTAKLHLLRRDRTAPVKLDTSGLSIESVVECATTHPLVYALDTPHHVLGQALVIQSPTECIAIRYRTRPDARALLWVERDGTTDKKSPMLFTQSQAILARTWVPLQDTPSVRFTYDATIHVPDGLWAVMSAENPQSPPADGVWRFAIKQPIPSYLMALAVGDLAFRAIGPRTGVYAEPSMVDKAKDEFVEVEAMIAATEKLYGPYRWGRYDLLVLPPSFPYGGMENPRLTFLTPTAITGDRSLVSLIAHELAHSWSGNLVTNASWSDFWLNEGFTTYFERRIMEELRGREVADLLWHLGESDLIESFGAKPGPDTRLALEVGDRDPDDVPSDAAYEKGAMFLRTLETAFGRAEFDAFLRKRFERLAFSSSTTAVFEADVQRDLMATHPDAITAARFASWIHDPGLPEGTTPQPSKRFAELEAIAVAYGNGVGFSPKAWSTLDWVIFLKRLPPTIKPEQLQLIGDTFGLRDHANAEVQMYWFPLVIRADDRESALAIQSYLMRIGRRRMIRPIYAAMIEKGGFWADLAKTTFERAKPLYHPIVRDTIAHMLGPS